MFDQLNFLNYPFMCSAWQKKPNFAEQMAEQTSQIARGATNGKMTTISLWNYSEVLKDDIKGKSECLV